ncbi:uncharacterized protein LOC115450526 [Manduca sexta]|uniref:Uncharacterized protein n=1 Tax=Manduca sexta TaxID=7130 RepID=A0A922CDD6_MANSE|nr:uncharacterized protein LOC115450526 [Manduca sexta]KAG6442131.1 hypothetical protein O3G_MSEX002227 [Manduca sexta]
MPSNPKKSKMTDKSSVCGESDLYYITPRSVSLSLLLQGESPGPGEWAFLVIFNGQVILDGKWQNGARISSEALPMNLKETYFQVLLADKPLIFILRIIGGKGAKDPDPLLNLDNRAGATVDLFPLVLGEEEIFINVPILLINTGEPCGCCVEVRAESCGITEIKKIPLTMTMLSAHCLPYTKDGTVYLSAVGLDKVLDRAAVDFSTSISFPQAEKIVWASVSNAGQAANSHYNVPHDDKFIPEDFEPKDNEMCRSFYWNSMRRVLVDPTLLRNRLSTPLLIEVAGVPRFGKIDVRGRYMGWIDAGVLLEAGQYSVTTCTKLLFFNEADLPENVNPLLELPPTSAKASARESDMIFDEYGHNAYIVMKFDLSEPLVPKQKMSFLFDTLGFSPPEGIATPLDGLEGIAPPEDLSIDVRRIRKEGGALAVHKELGGLACRGAVPMNQGIKRTAANRLLMRIRSMLKQFPPGDCSEIEWQDTVTAQHAACRRAVTSSFAPQPPPVRQTTPSAAARCRIAGDNRLAAIHTEENLKAAGDQPRVLLSKALRCLEERNDIDAKNYMLEALSAQARNKFVLWAYGAQEFDAGPEGAETTSAAFRIAVKGDYSDGTGNAIGWAALHALYHHWDNAHAAFVSSKKMRKSYELPRDWHKFLQRWIDTSGEEEVFWIPSVIAFDNPMLITAAFFLCLRCYKFVDRILQCVEQGCATRGCRHGTQLKMTSDIYYLKAASFLLKRQYDEAMNITIQGIKNFGPSPMMSQMRTSCLMSARGWDGECAFALKEAEKAGALVTPAILLQAALNGFKKNPRAALQRAARAHKAAPSGHSALIIARIYARLNEEVLAERWAAAAVKLEPQLSDGWAVLALLAMYEKNLDKARVMLRTARQVGPLSQDIDEEVGKVMDVVQLETLPDSLVKNICFCEYY